MSEILFHYERVHSTTWVYLSSLLTIALYFKFSRIWSVRNLDILGLLLLSPGLLLVEYGRTHGMPGIEHFGFIWLFATGGAFLVRLFLDSVMVRRPLLEPNLHVGGLTFLGVSLFLFLMANVATSSLSDDDLAGSRMAEQMQSPEEVSSEEIGFDTHGPGYPLLFWLPHISTQRILVTEDQGPRESVADEEIASEEVHSFTARIMAIFSHVLVVTGIVFIGYLHFDNMKTGIAVATLYLLVPYTAQQAGSVDHVLPAGLLVWVIVAYRRPLLAGLLMGLAIGVIYYPAFLLPLWIGFYWQRGLLRFLLGVALTISVLVVSLALTPADLPFLEQLKWMFGLRAPVMENLEGFWQPGRGIVPVYRLPVLAAFIAVCGSLAIWPAQKNLGTLMSCSAAVMLATQFWHAHGGGVYIAWYLPLLLLTIFRPNLEDRVALSVLGEGWFTRRRIAQQHIEQAA